MLAWLRQRLRSSLGREARQVLKLKIRAVWILLRHPQAPWPSRLVAGAVLLYALSPIDLVPDFIPVLGWIDELLLLPLGLALAVALAPAPLWAQCLAEAGRQVEAGQARPPRWWWGGVLVVVVWAALGVWAASALAGWWAGRVAGP